LAAGPQHANPWELCTAESFAILPMRQWGWRLQAPLPRKNPSLPSNVELKVNFFRPIWQAQLRAEGSVVHRGRTIGYVECDITDEKDRLVAKAASTCMVLRGQKSAGR